MCWRCRIHTSTTSYQKIGISASTISAPASTATGSLMVIMSHSSGYLGWVHKLPMFCFLGWGEGVVLLTLVSSGFNMGTGINFVLQGLLRVMVTATAASTANAPPAGTTLSNG